MIELIIMLFVALRRDTKIDNHNGQKKITALLSSER